jgi:hypothetical protein
MMKMLHRPKKLSASTLQSLFIVPGMLARSMDEWGIKKRATAGKSDGDANAMAPPNEPNVNAVSFAERSLTETHYYSATDPPSERISTPITEANVEPATADTSSEASEYRGNSDDRKHVASDKEEGRKSDAEEQRNASSQRLKESMSKIFPPRTCEFEEGVDGKTDDQTQHISAAAQGTEDGNTDLKDGKAEDDRS